MSLKFLHQLGVTHVFQEMPRNRLDEKVEPMTKIAHAPVPMSASIPVVESPTPVMKTKAPLIPPPTSAHHPAYAAKTLPELRQVMEDFEGCNLKHGATQMVFCDGNPDADVMLIGEAPGEEEDKQGKPFVGRSGQLLDKMLLAIGLDRTSVYIANIVPWRPPGNRQPSSEEITACLPFIEHHILLKKPKFLLLLGGVATKSLLKTHEGIMSLRGKWLDYTPPHAPKDMVPVRLLPTYHPAFLLRSPGQKVYAWEDLKSLRAAIDS